MVTPPILIDRANLTPKRECEDPQDKVLKECKGFLQDSRRLRDLAALKASDKTKLERINRLTSTRHCLRSGEKQKVIQWVDFTKGINETEIQKWKEA